jgi:RAB protein geranylgeranyltransferase component A
LCQFSKSKVQVMKFFNFVSNIRHHSERLD